MARLLFTVEDTFEIRNRGLVLVPGIIPEGDERFRIGAPITLLRPDGSSLDAQIGGIDMFSPIPKVNWSSCSKGSQRVMFPLGPRCGRSMPDFTRQQCRLDQHIACPSSSGVCGMPESTPMDDQSRSEVIQPADDVYAWIEDGTSIHLKAVTKFGDPVELNADQVRDIANALLDLASQLESC
ncbi:hypothetical protein EP7_000402 [Isosphaeraceae bacterium EP7]